MKYYYLPVAALMLGLFSCNTSSKTVSPSQQLTGKLVISELCNHYVVSVEKGNIDTAKVVADYKDEKRSATFKNAFTVANICSFSKEGLQEGDSFTFELTDQMEEGCANCLAYYPTPDKKLFIKSIKKITSK